MSVARSARLRPWAVRSCTNRNRKGSLVGLLSERFMRKDVVAPSVGESITEVAILKWAKKHGEAVKNGELLLEIESDKATVEIVAEHTGTLQILKQAGERIPIGAVIGFVDDSIPASASAGPSAPPPPLPGAAAKKA